MVANAAQSTDVTLLRPPRRDVTRGRICAAAREVFLRSGYGAATLEHIALEAGLRRSTLYNHFRDKGEILAAIADDYLGAVTGVIGRLPPRPSRRQIDYWIGEFAEFVLVERAPTTMRTRSRSSRNERSMAFAGGRFMVTIAIPSRSSIAT